MGNVPAEPQDPYRSSSWCDLNLYPFCENGETKQVIPQEISLIPFVFMGNLHELSKWFKEKEKNSQVKKKSSITQAFDTGIPWQILGEILTMQKSC